MTGENAGSKAGSLAETLAGNAGSETGFAYEVKYWTLEQAEAMPDWPSMEEEDDE